MENKSEFRKLPSVDRILNDDQIKLLASVFPHDTLVTVIRRYLTEAQQTITCGRPAPSYEEAVDTVFRFLNNLGHPSLRPVINATGVILHTNLGRAPLSHETMEAMERAAKSYCNLEFELESGYRGSRQEHVETLLCQLTGATAALVVNNNAAAVLLSLSALAKRKEVIVSRGQAVEIGGGFRIPDVMRQSGTKLVEVGTTNVTKISDYEEAVTPHTAGLLRVHSSNFKVVGFTGETTMDELATLAQRKNLILFDDLGSGCFIDTLPFGLAAEPMVQASVSAGASVICFSGDKLVGGPQAGIIVGQKILLDKLKSHPLARAVRIDKIRLAGLAATFIHYLKGEALEKVPVWSMIATPVYELEQRATRWAAALGHRASVIDGESMVGGGSLPGGTLPTKVVAIGQADKQKSNRYAINLAMHLRQMETPIIGRISGNLLLFDPRSVLPEEDKVVLNTFKNI